MTETECGVCLRHDIFGPTDNRERRRRINRARGTDIVPFDAEHHYSTSVSLPMILSPKGSNMTLGKYIYIQNISKISFLGKQLWSLAIKRFIFETPFEGPLLPCETILVSILLSIITYLVTCASAVHTSVHGGKSLESLLGAFPVADVYANYLHILVLFLKGFQVTQSLGYAVNLCFESGVVIHFTKQFFTSLCVRKYIKRLK